MLKVFHRFAFEVREFRTRIFSLYWGFRLGEARLWLHWSGRIIGSKYMQFAPHFRAGRLLWLEAIFSYQDKVFSPKITIGRHFACGDLVHIACAFRVDIGDNVLLGSRIHITDHNHGAYSLAPQSLPSEPPLSRALSGLPVSIGSNVFIGDGVIILPGSNIGDGVIIGANSLVNCTLPSNTICVGSPAAPIKVFNANENKWLPV